MDDVNQAATATKPRQRMFSTAASQGAIFGALAALPLVMWRSAGLRPDDVGPYHLGSHTIWVAAGLVVLSFVSPWIEWRSTPESWSWSVKYDGMAGMKRTWSVIGWMLFGLPYLFLFGSVYLIGAPGFQKSSLPRRIAWLIASPILTVFSGLVDSGFLYRGTTLDGELILGVSFSVAIMTVICGDTRVHPLARVFCGVCGILPVIALSSFVSSVVDDYGYPFILNWQQFFVFVFGGPIMGFVTWGLMDWFASPPVSKPPPAWRIALYRKVNNMMRV